jgi:rare lipoprotein A
VKGATFTRTFTLAVALAGCSAPSQQLPSTVSVQTVKRGGGTVQEGMATWYGRDHHGRLTANGERFDMNAMTAAHRTLRMHTRVRVTNLKNGRTVVVRINDRGPYGKGRIIDVSYAAARELDMIDAGVVPSRVEVLAVP